MVQIDHAPEPADRSTIDVLRDLVRDAERASIAVRTSTLAATRNETAAVLDRCALALRLLLDNDGTAR